MRFLMTWHRRAAWLVAVPLMLWLLSGLLHPLMAWVLKPPMEGHQIVRPLLPSAAEVRPVDVLLQEKDIDAVTNVQLQQIDGGWQYRVVEAGHTQPRYFHADSSEEIAHGDRLHAIWLARMLVDDPDAGILSAIPLEQFSNEYREVNRLLPVWRVALEREDGLTLYLDTEQQRLASAATWGRRQALKAFSWFHSWHWLPHAARTPVVLLFSVPLLLMSLGGLILLVRRWRHLNKGNGVRRWHRWLTLVGGLSLFGFASSGVHVAIDKLNPPQWIDFRDDTLIAVSSLATNPLTLMDRAVAVRPVQVGDDVLWQFQQQGENGVTALQYVNAVKGEKVTGADEAYAKKLVERFVGESVEVRDTELLTKFRFDYPSVYKRLPVRKLSLVNQPQLAMLVETRSGHMANEVTPSSILRALHFINLHKYHFVGRLGLSPPQRDAVMVVLVLLILAALVSGMLLAWRRLGKG